MLKETVTNIAFFDVDETILDGKSMALFLDFAAQRLDGLPSWSDFWSSLDPTWGRSRGNREYYEIWKGYREDVVLQLGREWFEREGISRLLIGSTTRRLRQHHELGHKVVLVTGSFDAPIAPLFDFLQCDKLLATKLETLNGCYTGAIERSMIGENKAYAATNYLQSIGDSVGQVWAYGDHVSDSPLLSLAHERYLVTKNKESTYEDIPTLDNVTIIGHDDIMEEPYAP